MGHCFKKSRYSTQHPTCHIMYLYGAMDCDHGRMVMYSDGDGDV